MFPAKHSAFSMSLPGAVAPVKPVRFPGDLWVTEIWSTAFPGGDTGYQVYYQPCNEMRGYFNHLKEVSPVLKTAFDAGQKQCQDFVDQTGTILKCQVKVVVKVQAGETMGTSGDGSAGLDFGLADFRRPVQGLAIPEHYSSDYPYYVSPIDYYPADTRAAFEAKLGGYDGVSPRTALPRAGTYLQDIAGTAQGNWFFPKIYYRTSTDISSAMALASDYVDPAQPVFSMGTSVSGVKMGLYTFALAPDTAEDRRVNIAFSKVKVNGNIYCYDGFRTGRTAGALPTGTIDGVLLLSLPTDTTLKVEKAGAAGATCEALRPWVFTGAATIFER
jgi:hypothetical protein